MTLPVRAKIAPKGTGGNSFFDNLIDRGTEALGDAVSDAIGDGLADAIGGEVGGILGGELGSRVGNGGSGPGPLSHPGLGETINSALRENAGGAEGDFLSTDIGSGIQNEGYFDGPARILKRTGGLVYPNTPTIQTSHTANWNDYDLTHTNYAYWAYQNSKIDNITVSGKFTVNTRAEADYIVGAVHFLRSATKMHFGANDTRAGTPPPVMEFTALGPSMFNNVPVVIVNFANNFEESYDYVISSTGTYVPTSTILTVTLSPYYNPSDLQNEFSLDKFKKGNLLKDGWI